MDFLKFASIVDSYFRKYSTNRSEFSKEIFEDILDKAEKDRKIKNSPSTSLELECKKYYLYKKYHLKFYRFLYREWQLTIKKLLESYLLIQILKANIMREEPQNTSI